MLMYKNFKVVHDQANVCILYTYYNWDKFIYWHLN